MLRFLQESINNTKNERTQVFRCMYYRQFIVNKSTANGYQRSTVMCWVVDKKSKSKNGHNSYKNTFRVISLGRMDCSFDSEDIVNY